MDVCVGVLLWHVLVGISFFSSAEFCIPDTNGKRSQDYVTEKTPNLPPKSWVSLGRESVIGVWMKTLFTNTFIRRTTLTVTRSQAEG